MMFEFEIKTCVYVEQVKAKPRTRSNRSKRLLGAYSF